MEIRFEMQGHKAVLRAFEAMRRNTQRATVTKAARVAAKRIGEEARRRAPRHPGGPSHPGQGHAYKTIKWINVERWPDRATFAIGATDHGFYLNFHETGTVKMAARPWLRPALDAVGARAVQDAGDVFREAVLQAAAKAKGKK